MKKIWVGTTALCLLFAVGAANAAADKFGGSFSNDYSTQTKQQNIPVPTISIPATPTTQTTTVSTSEISTPVVSAPDVSSPVVPQQVAAPETPWVAPTVAPAATQPATVVSAGPAPQAPSAAPIVPSPTTGPGINNVPSMQKTRISVPDFEEKYKRMLMAQAEAKKHKKKSLIDSILDELVHYGMFLILGIVILVVIYALRKDKETPGTGFHLPEQPSSKLPQEPKKDIWHDEF